MVKFKSLRDFIEYFDKKGEVVYIDDPVSLDLEIAEILRQVMYREGPIIIFKNIIENTFPAVGNLFGKWNRVIEVFDEDPIKKVREFLDLIEFKPLTLIEKIKSIPDVMKLSKYLPKITSKGTVKKIEFDVDLSKIPAIRQWSFEPSKFITFGITFVKRDNKINFGYYRLQVIGKDKLIMHWMPWRKSREYAEYVLEEKDYVDVAIVFGPDPITMIMAGISIPQPLDKLLITNALRGESLELTKGDEVDVYYPANAELVIEGRIEKFKTALEGPFGDHAGYYSIAKEYPVVKVLKIMGCCEKPLIPITTVGKPVLEDGNIIRIGEHIVLPLLKLVLPEIVDIHIPPEGVGYFTIISIRKRYPGHAKRVMLFLWSMTPLMNKFIIIVDHDVNIRNWNEVIYAISVNVDPKRDVLIIPDYPTEELDPATPIPGFGSKIGIDATRKLPEEYMGKEYPIDVKPDEEIVNKVKSIISRIFRKQFSM